MASAPPTDTNRPDFAGTTRQDVTGYGCVWARTNLDRLAGALAAETTPNEPLFTSVRVGTELKRETLDLLHAALRQSLRPGDPDQPDNLAMESQRGDRLIRIEIDEVSTRAFVKGLDATWVDGMAYQLGLLFRDTGGSPHPNRWTKWLCSLVGAAGAIVVAVASLALGWIPLGGVTLLLLNLVVLLGGATGYVVGRRRSWRARTVILLDGSHVAGRRAVAVPWAGRGADPLSRSDKIAVWILIVGILAVLVGIGGVTLAHLDSVHEKASRRASTSQSSA